MSILRVTGGNQIGRNRFSLPDEAVTEARAMIPGYIADHPEFREVGERMVAQWKEGVNGLTG